MSKVFADSQSSECPQCGKVFECLAATNVEDCWCMSLPPVSFKDGEKSSSCWCPGCLQQQLEKQSKQD
jgi:hypothetical protein